MFVLFPLILICLIILICLPRRSIFRVQHDEWTAFEKGKPVCGVGYRGFWTNKTIIGDWPSYIHQKEDGTFIDKRTMKLIKTQTLNEFLNDVTHREKE